jgi:catechol 2,3-dioxygenase-like lactoylglutathione lyase family enzyme
MSALAGCARRADTLGVHSIHEFVFRVPDLGQAARFYRAFGLDVREEADGLSLYTFGHPHRWARVLPGAAKRLAWISWGVYPDDLAAFETRFRTHDVARIEAPAGALRGGLWFTGPDGLPQQLIPAEKCTPDHKSTRVFPPEISIAGRAPHRSNVREVRPRRLSHILVFSADVDTALRFYAGVLGLRLSDRSGDLIAFMHGPHGSDHHLIALAQSTGYGLHHCSWDVASLDEVGLGKQQCAAAGYAEGWGLGRHVLGSNYFRYVRDPWGSYSEYSFDIDHIAATRDWPADDHPPEDSLYVWGDAPPADFIHNYEIS